MEIERERGISVVTSVMTFEYGDHVFNLLDTPGHEDFSDDTYRTLTAVDSAVMVIDAAKGIEARTLQAVRGLPAARHPDHHLRQQDGPREPRPVRPARRDREEAGARHRADDLADRPRQDLRRHLPSRRERASASIDADDEAHAGQRSRIRPLFAGLLPENEREAFIEELALAREACRPFDLEAFREGHLTPVFFGSALRNFGVRDLIDALGAFAPPPRDQEADTRMVEATEPTMTAFVFKIQANMDPNHRDRIAFVRVCSGKLERGMKAKLVRTGKPMSADGAAILLRPQDRAIADEAFAGDVVGIPNHGTLRIGDTLTEGEDIAVPRRAELRAGNPAPRPARRRDEGEEAAGKRCSRWPRRASCSCSRRRTARRRSSAWSARCSSTC